MPLATLRVIDAASGREDRRTVSADEIGETGEGDVQAALDAIDGVIAGILTSITTIQNDIVALQAALADPQLVTVQPTFIGQLVFDLNPGPPASVLLAFINGDMVPDGQFSYASPNVTFSGLSYDLDPQDNVSFLVKP